MTPHAIHLLSAELIRDGGSLGASFLDTRGSEQMLFFAVQRKTLSSGHSERTGFAEPVVIDRLSGAETQLSWRAAQILIAELQEMARDDRLLEWLSAMAEVAASAGDPLPKSPLLAQSYRLGPARRLTSR